MTFLEHCLLSDSRASSGFFVLKALRKLSSSGYLPVSEFLRVLPALSGCECQGGLVCLSFTSGRLHWDLVRPGNRVQALGGLGALRDWV